LIIDLEGEPARPLSFRRSKLSPLKDVAGMLRSFSYAAVATLFDRAEPDSDEWTRLLPWATSWESLARDRYLTGYLGKAHEGHYLPVDRDEIMTMLDVFEIDKALYELNYERNNRPNWVRIPLMGITNVIERGHTR
jgi:maltose alpha-D-glucosyltransferase/alpha-amylase